MSEWSDDDEVPVAPPPSTIVPPRDTRVEGQSEGGEVVPEQQAMGVPMQQANGAPEQRARGVLERQVEERPMAETARPPPQGRGWALRWAMLVQKSGPAGRHVRVLALELFCCRILISFGN